LTRDPPDRLGIQLFGQPRFTFGDVTLRLNMRPRCLPLLAYLLLNRDRAIARTTLALSLWDDEPEDSARANLRRHLHELSNALPASFEPWIQSASDTVAWNPAANVWLDVAEFERLAKAGDAAAAVELYRGDLLENSYDECLFSARERLRSVYLALLKELVVERRGERRFTQAIDYAQRILALDPWREDVVRQLIAARYESADRAGALQTYDLFSRSLRRELDVDPMPETASLRDVVFRNSVVAAADGSEVDVRRPGTLPPFVGRETELQQLNAAWSRAARGRGTCFLVAGEAGIGKTRLAAQFTQRAEAEGARVLWGATSPPERIPYEALVDALRNALPMLAAASIKPLWLGALAQLLPEVAERRSDVPALVAIEPERERTRLFEAIAIALEALSAPRPVVLVLEDLHWADTATIAAVEFAVQRIGQKPIFILGTYRDEEAGRTHPLRELRRRLQPLTLMSHLALGRLSADAVTEWVTRSEAVEIPAVRALAARLHEVTEGNPLLLVEAMRLVAEGSSIDGSVAKLQPLIAARVGRLSAACQDLAGIAASIGPSFDVDVLRDVSGWAEDSVIAGLDEMQDHGFIREPAGRHQFDFIFTHHLIAAAVYELSPPRLRVRRHRRIARVFEELGSRDKRGNAAEIARHCELAGERERAAANYVAAARQGLAVYANEVALRHARRALELVGADDSLHFEALAICESMNARIGDAPAQRADLTALALLTASSENRDHRCDVLRRWIAFHRTQGERAEEADAISKLAREAEQSGDARWRAEALEAQATHLELMGNADAALPIAKRAVAEYEAAGNKRGAVFALSLEGAVAAFVGDVAGADHAIERARLLACDDQSLLARVLRCEVSVCHWTQRWSRHAAATREAIELARAVGDRDVEATSLGAAALSAARAFRVSEAREAYARAMDIFVAIGKIQGLAVVCLNASALEIETGRFGEALALVERTEAIGRRTDWRHGLALCTANRAYIACLSGDFTAARDRALEFLAQARSLGSERLEAGALSQLGAALRRLGENPAAVERLSEAAGTFARHGAVESLCETHAELALAALSAGEATRACDLATSVALRCEDVEASGWAALPVTLWCAARVLRAAGDPLQGLELIQRARSCLHERARGFSDDEGRAMYLGLPEHAAILAAVAAAESRPPS